MNSKALLITLVSFLWGGASWWWYTCQIKGACETHHTAVLNHDERTNAIIFKSVSDDAKIVKPINDSSHPILLSQVVDENSQSTPIGDKNKTTKEIENAENTKAVQNITPLDNANNNGDEKNDSKRLNSPDIEMEKSIEDLKIKDPLIKETKNLNTPDNDKNKDENNDNDKNKESSQAQDEKETKTEEVIEKLSFESPEEDNKNSKAIKLKILGKKKAKQSDLPKRVRIYYPKRTNKPEISKNVAYYLDELSIYMQENNAKITVTGHTDNVGTAKRNKKVGLRRAKKVLNLLVKRGVPSEKIEAKSRGEMSPIEDNETSEGREKNRRVEITIY